MPAALEAFDRLDEPWRVALDALGQLSGDA
jgi:hypothetical protein